MDAVLQGENTMEAQPISATPYGDITMDEGHPDCPIRPLLAAPEECRRKPKGHRNDGRAKVPFVAILMQRQACPGSVSIDQARIGAEVRKTGRLGRSPGQGAKHLRHRRPRLAAVRIDGIVPVAGSVGDPSRATAV